MSAEPRRTTADLSSRIQSSAFWLAAVLLATVPVTIVTSTYRSYSLPRFAVLLVGASILVPLIVLVAPRSWALLRSWQLALISLYLLAVAASSVFGAAPYVSALGSFENQMGLVTQVCFFVCFIGLVTGIGESPARFRSALWAMALPGLVIALYALAQSAAFDPFVPPRLYTYGSGGERIIRAVGTLGHADFLGNFLLYTTPLSGGLALASGGRARRIAFAGAGLSTAAIALSGTRGAWLGLLAGLVVFAVLAAPRSVATGRSLLSRISRPLPRLLFASIILAVLVLALSYGPASHNITARAKAFVSERLTGAGRTLLWRDSLGMVAAHPLRGCGAEAFRKAFLPYKSRELARLIGNIQNESSHNSYLDAAISYGIPGAVLYVAVIASSLALLFQARRRADRKRSILLTGVIASFVAAAVHKVFIFDQISTGLYFFAFLALAASASNLARATQAGPLRDGARISSRPSVPATALAAILGVPLVAAAVWYSASLLKADFEIRAALDSASEASYEPLVEHGGRAASAPDPSGGYRFLFARALADWVARIRSAGGNKSSESQIGPALDLAISDAGESARHGISPDSSYVLLCFLSSEKRDYPSLQAYATEVIALDPFYAPAHLFLAEAYLGTEEEDAAKREVAIWLDLTGQPVGGGLKRSKVQDFIDSSHALARQDDYLKARLELTKGAVAAADACSGCHIALAAAYEEAGFYEDAMEAWQRLSEHDPASARSEDAFARIESLKLKASRQSHTR